MRRSLQIAVLVSLAGAGIALAGRGTGWPPTGRTRQVPARPATIPAAPGPASGTGAEVPIAAPAAAVPAAAPTDTIFHVVAAGDCLQQIASRYRARAGWWRTAEVVAAIRAANGLESDLLRPGRTLSVPPAGPEPHPVVAEPVRRGAGLRGIYLPAAALAASDLFARVDGFLAAGGNGVVLDAKDADGRPSYRSAVPLAAVTGGAAVGDLGELVERLHRRRAWVAARLACFLDGDLGARRPDLALPAPGGGPWRERDLVWLDPGQPEVRRYLVDLARELARAGVDEVQLDYVRYPTNQPAAGAADRRTAAITAFVAEMAAALRPAGVVLSADLFGVVAWQRPVDRAATGQDVAALAGLADVLCPMVYPSHYGPGFGGVGNPGDEPERFVAEGSRRFAALSAGRALVRPWLQAFPYRASAYGGAYVQAQIAGAAGAGASGWCLWNPGGRYGELLPAVAAANAPRSPTPVAGVPAIAAASITSTAASALPGLGRLAGGLR